MALTHPHGSGRPELLALIGRLLLPLLAACYAAGTMPYSSLWPLTLAAEDLQVYVNAAHFLLRGEDMYASTVTFPYLYPPIAAVLVVPFAVLPWVLGRFCWMALNACLVTAVVHRLGLRDWRCGWVSAGVIVLVAPVTSTVGLGQMGVVLLALIVFDLVPGQGRRRLPGGVWIGLATGIKLTPAVFIVHLFLTGRRREALTAVGTFLATVLLGVLVTPGPALGYWGRLAHGDSGANPDAFGWINNRSVTSAAQRFLGVEAGTLPGLALSALLVAAGLYAAYRCHRAGQSLLGIGLLGMVSSFANPITWGHHLVWVVPLVIGAVRATGPVRASALLAAAWSTLFPEGQLGGAPWAEQEIHGYSPAQKLFAAGGALTTTVAVVLAAVLVGSGVRHARTAERSEQPEPTVNPG